MGSQSREEGLPADLCYALFSDLCVAVGQCADFESDVAFLFNFADSYHVHCKCFSKNLKECNAESGHKNCLDSIFLDERVVKSCDSGF